MTEILNYKLSRGRRLRRNNFIRDLTAETFLTINDLVMPIFVTEEKDFIIEKMPDMKRVSLNSLQDELKEIVDLGIKAVALFPVIDKKDKSEKASEATNPDNLICKCLKTISKNFPNLIVICDVALDAYTQSGQDGILNSLNEVDNDKTVEILSIMSNNFASYGCKTLGLSDMMDGRVESIRKNLELNGFIDVCIISYSAKYCSHLYSPFRDALGSEKNLGQKTKGTYQLDYRNSFEAVKETLKDVNEGADIIMVKPATFYLDIINELKKKVNLPIAAYQVSGEYSMIKIAGNKQIIDYKSTVIESLSCIKRAGADMIFSYFSKEVSAWLK